MRLHMADFLLYRASLFRDKGALAEARKLIEQCGYWRRKEELEDAEPALAKDCMHSENAPANLRREWFIMPINMATWRAPVPRAHVGLCPEKL